MIAGRIERVGQAGEQLAIVMKDRAGLAVHKSFGTDNPAAEGLADRLVAETDAEDWQLAGKIFDNLNRDPGLIRRAWPR